MIFKTFVINFVCLQPNCDLVLNPYITTTNLLFRLIERCLPIPSHGVLTGAHPTRGVRLLSMWDDPERPVQVSDLTPGLPEAMDGLTVRPSWAVGAHLGDAVVVDR